MMGQSYWEFKGGNFFETQCSNVRTSHTWQDFLKPAYHLLLICSGCFCYYVHIIELQSLIFGNFLDVTVLCLIFSANSRQSRPGESGSGRIGSSSSLGAAQERLKPPVSVVSMERKVIKLSGSKNTGSVSSSKDRVCMQMQNSRNLEQSAVSESNSVSRSCGDSSVVTSSSSRSIRPSQPGLVSISEKSQQQQNMVDVSSNTLAAKRTSVDAGETEKKKFKATAITWP